jgi:hypothetical protein
MNRRTILPVLFIISMFASSAFAGNSLHIRLVRASNSGDGVDPRLTDVVKVLKRTLVFKSYSLVAAARQSLPARVSESGLAEFKVKCSGAQNNLKITVRRGKTVLLNTTVDLKDNTPLVLGGFPGKGGQHVLIFVAEKSPPARRIGPPARPRRPR